MSTLSTQDARRVLDAALAHASELGAAVAVAVVDAGGHPLALVRMDGATFLSGSLAVNKAASSAGLGMATQDLMEFAGGTPPLLAGLTTQSVAVLPGGAPIFVDGAIAGAVGVAGGTRGEDHPIATAGIAAIAATPAGV